MEVLFKEHYGPKGSWVQYVKPEGQRAVVRADTHVEQKTLHSLGQLFMSVFLPQGYPHSVSSDYFNYQKWDTLQAFASSITGALAMQAVLKGVGVGDEAATPLAATITWLMKDGVGMLGRITFAWWKGTSLDCDSKKWRLFADILNDAAIFLELTAPLVPCCFTFLVCVAGLAKSVVGVAGASTRAALTQHQARRDNLADVSAKDGSQETMVNLAALVTSLGLLPLVSGSQGLTWLLFLVFTAFHMYANYRAVTAVTMETLNRARLLLLLQDYLKDGRILSVRSANSSEAVLVGSGLKDYNLCGYKIVLGSSLQRAASVLAGASELSSLLQAYESHWYIVFVDEERREVCVVLHENSASHDHLQAYYHAVVMATLRTAQRGSTLTCLQGRISEASPLQILVKDLVGKEVVSEEYLKDAVTKFVAENFPSLLLRLEHRGWVTSHNLLAPDEWRGNWQVHQKK